MIKEQAVGFGFAVLFTFHREHFHLNDKTTEINTKIQTIHRIEKINMSL